MSALHPARQFPRRVLGAFVLIVYSLTICAWPATKSSLPEKYKKWMQQEVPYIITNEERKAFLELAADADRDTFIEHFWDIRNPTPGSPENSYKAEHYRRLAYANQFFGHIAHTEGWRTDMGRVYITLGEPSQRQKLLGEQKITPMEIWFFSNANPALPPFFYVIFYQRDPMDEFRIYHPFSDGPERLITAVSGPTRQDALKIIAQDAGKDVAKETLSLLPDEPVDFASGTISLASDVMLDTIHDLANSPLSKEELNNRRRLLEDVTSRVVLGEEFLDVLTVPLRDSKGNTNLHYLLRLKKPEDFSIGKSEKEGYYYSILVSINVKAGDGKFIFSEEKKISKSVSSDEFETVKGKIFGYEGLLPLPPGNYKIDFEMTNRLTNLAYRRAVTVAVPATPATGVQVSNLVPFVNAKKIEQHASQVVPFSGAGVKFVPRTGDELQLVQGEPLRFFYQVWAPSLMSANPRESADRKIEVDYVYGRLGGQDSKTITDQIPLDQLDASGSEISGKQILTAELPAGRYRLVMTLHDPQAQAKVYDSLNFTISATNSSPAAWDVTAEAGQPGEADWQRALCFLANGKKEEAMEWLHVAHATDPASEPFRDKLIELYFEQQQYLKAIDAYSQGGAGNTTDEQALVLVAESFSKTGNLPKAIAVVESGTEQNPKSATLQLALADYYRKSGNLEKAAAAEQKGKQLMAAGAASPAINSDGQAHLP